VRPAQGASAAADPSIVARPGQFEPRAGLPTAPVAIPPVAAAAEPIAHGLSPEAPAAVAAPGSVAEPALPPVPTEGRHEPAPGPGPAPVNGHPQGPPVCTAPQLRRFIKSRTWVPMHELRRRFGINGADDDVTSVAVDGNTIFVGLPNREGQLLGELLRGGDIGYELSMDPSTPIVIGVYPMRPVPRH
jgi:hypothetical protein